MITTILRAPTGAGISYYALQLADRAHTASRYPDPVAIIVPPRTEIIERWKRIANILDILVNVYRPNQWGRLRAGQGQGIVLVHHLEHYHLRPIWQALHEDENEYWLLNPPLEVEMSVTLKHLPLEQTVD